VSGQPPSGMVTSEADADDSEDALPELLEPGALEGLLALASPSEEDAEPGVSELPLSDDDAMVALSDDDAMVALSDDDAMVALSDDDAMVVLSDDDANVVLSSEDVSEALEAEVELSALVWIEVALVADGLVEVADVVPTDAEGVPLEAWVVPVEADAIEEVAPVLAPASLVFPADPPEEPHPGNPTTTTTAAGKKLRIFSIIIGTPGEVPARNLPALRRGGCRQT
jgi:hypothetical protein